MEAQCAGKRSLSPVFRETSWARDRVATSVVMRSTQRRVLRRRAVLKYSPQAPLPLKLPRGVHVIHVMKCVSNACMCTLYSTFAQNGEYETLCGKKVQNGSNFVTEIGAR